MKLKGIRRERILRDLALSTGAVNVIRAAGSLGKIDLVIDFPSITVRAQVKSNHWPPKEESEKLDWLAAELDSRTYAIVTVRVDDGIASGLGSTPVTYRVRLHVGPGVDRPEFSWDEFAACCVRSKGYLILRGGLSSAEPK